MGNTNARSGRAYFRRLFEEIGFGSAAIVAACLTINLGAPPSRGADVDGKKSSLQTVAQGRALFEREWQAADSRSHGGDGLGPVYNDSSCVACHNLGGTGGAGAAGKNVDIITATHNGVTVAPTPAPFPEERGFLSKA